MKKFLKVLLFYGIGLSVFLVFAWRANEIDKKNDKLASNCNYEIVTYCNY